MILMRANPFRGPLEGVGTEMKSSKARLLMAREVDLPPSKSFEFECRIKNIYIGNFMYMSFAAAV